MGKNKRQGKCGEEDKEKQRERERERVWRMEVMGKRNESSFQE